MNSSARKLIINKLIPRNTPDQPTNLTIDAKHSGGGRRGSASNVSRTIERRKQRGRIASRPAVDTTSDHAVGLQPPTTKFLSNTQRLTFLTLANQPRGTTNGPPHMKRLDQNLRSDSRTAPHTSILNTLRCRQGDRAGQLTDSQAEPSDQNGESRRTRSCLVPLDSLPLTDH